MRRREFIAGLGSAVAWPLAAHAQQPALPVIGFLNGTSFSGWETQESGFRKGLIEAGYVEGQNVAIDYRRAEGQFHQLPQLAADLINRPVGLIVASGGAAVPLAAKRATSTIPIVFATGADPVKLGLVSSFNRPGGNATGVYFTVTSLGSKRLELLRELVPQARTVGILINPDNPTGDEQKKDMQVAATAMGLQIIVVEASRERDIDMAFAALVEHHATAVVVGADAFFLNRQHQLIALAARHALPAMYHLREMTVAGGLMSYGPDITNAHRLAGTYAGRILKGEKPAEMPVIQPTKFELIINLKTATVLGLDIPPKVLALADEAIE